MSAEQSSTQPDPNANPATDPAREGNQFAQSLSASMGANMRRTANGDVDILHAIGGWRGLVESSLPAVAFLVLFTVTKELNLSLIAALAAAGVFTLIRLVQGSKLVSALTGLVGVAICAFAAYRTGNASDYFVVGFWTNGVYILAYLLSMLVRWPLMGLIFAVIRSEALSWRQNPGRLRQHMKVWGAHHNTFLPKSYVPYIPRSQKCSLSSETEFYLKSYFLAQNFRSLYHYSSLAKNKHMASPSPA